MCLRLGTTEVLSRKAAVVSAGIVYLLYSTRKEPQADTAAVQGCGCEDTTPDRYVTKHFLCPNVRA